MNNRTYPLWFARVSGSHAEMGRQHGTMLAVAGGGTAAIHHYRDMPAQLLTGDVPAPLRPIVAHAIRGGAELLLARLEADRAPDLVARSRAFLEALGQPPAWSRYLAVMDLVQNVVGVAARWRLGPFSAPARAVAFAAAQPACSTAIVWGDGARDGRLRHARNFDFPGVGVWDAAPAVVMCRPDHGQSYGFITTRGGDTPVVTVWNQAGLVFTSHTRFHRQVRFGGATVVDLIHELAANAESLADVERLARRRPVASSWGIAVSSWRERRALALEIHAGRVAVVAPTADATHLVVANRYRDRAMQDGEVTATPAWALHSDRREARLTQLLAAARTMAGADAATLIAMLTDRRDPDAVEVERHLGGVIAQPCQVHSVVVEPELQRIHLGMAAAPVGAGAWLAFDYQWHGAVGSWEVGTPMPPDLGFAIGDTMQIARSPATDAVARAMAHEQSTHDVAAIATALAEAIGHAPGDPSLHLAMVWNCMRRRQWRVAVEHARAGLAIETLAYRRGQLLLWGSRAAAAADEVATCAAWRRELQSSSGSEIASLREQARVDAELPARRFRRAPHANLFMHDATY
jgi:Acyl-coenzyme A:6-aminopenicillanic acid acyl-transferase